PIYRLRVLTNRGTDTYVTGEFNAGASVKNGKVVGVVGIARDITSQLDAEKKIAALNDLRNTFIQIVSHQLRTPLNAIRWNLETLLAEELGKLRQSQKDFIRVTLGADVEVIDRIHEFLTALDIEEGRANFNPEDVALQSLIKDVMPTYEQKAKLKSVKLTYVPSRKAVPKLKIDQAKMRTVLELLIDNAITYTPQGGNVTITLSANGRIRLEVADTGVGIPATDQEKIFEKFFRSSNAILVKPDSSGLGLYIAHYYVTKQGGTIGFTSSAEKGSVFWIEFPL
ncbi:MAG: HAMP domain-containing sensor histidine kinase, partial [Patescibacteria group bacterium]